MSDDIAIKVSNVSKTFILPHQKNTSIKGAFINFYKRKKVHEKQQVLRDVSFEVRKGEFFGIVGRNGSGKSTLLKLISQIYTPDSGDIQINGKLVPFIELGVGFNHELSGRENVYLNGALLGFSRREMDAMYDEIVEFAELERFMDQKLKNYSSGMQVRLAFSIAIRAQSDILVLDEVLAVGDEAFQRKCEDYFSKVKMKGKTIILVTHSMDSVRRYCDRAILIEDGKIGKAGKPDKVAAAYSDIFIEEQIAELEKKDERKVGNSQISDVEIESLGIYQSNKKVRAVKFKKDFSLRVELNAGKPHYDLTMGVHFIDQSGRDMLAISTKVFGAFDLKKGRNLITFNIQNILRDGDYYINLAVEENSTKKLLVKSHEISPFSVVGLNLSQYSKQSLTYPEVEVSFERR